MLMICKQDGIIRHNFIVDKKGKTTGRRCDVGLGKLTHWTYNLEILIMVELVSHTLGGVLWCP